MKIIVAFTSHLVAVGRDRLVVRTPRCGRGNPGSNPGHGNLKEFFLPFFNTCKIMDSDLSNINKGTIFFFTNTNTKGYTMKKLLVLIDSLFVATVLDRLVITTTPLIWL